MLTVRFVAWGLLRYAKGNVANTHKTQNVRLLCFRAGMNNCDSPLLFFFSEVTSPDETDFLTVEEWLPPPSPSTKMLSWWGLFQAFMIDGGYALEAAGQTFVCIAPFYQERQTWSVTASTALCWVSQWLTRTLYDFSAKQCPVGWNNAANEPLLHDRLCLLNPGVNIILLLKT